MAEGLPAQPLADWLTGRVDRFGGPHVARELGCSERLILRYRNAMQDGFRDGKRADVPCETYDRGMVEELLDGSGFFIWDVYPDVVDDDQVREAYCTTCHEVVGITAANLCLWCDSPTQVIEAKERLWCKACDRLVWPTGPGCWRCHTKLKKVPWEDCECGCDTKVHRFDRHGRRIKFARGHAPRTREANPDLPVDRFREWLAGQVKTADPIGAVASLTGLTKLEILDVIEGRVGTFPKKRIQHALWAAARNGAGKGSVQDINVPTLGVMYPEWVRSKVCPGCGEGKAPHAELCKKCRKRANAEERVALRSVA